jgi:hypothetical protein
MLQVTATLQKQTSLFTEEQLTFSPGDSLASLIALQESEKAKKMHATCGLKCSEQFGRFPRATLWAKTLAALLVGMEGWYSTKCKLTWKLRTTKYYRFYFQLAPSTLRTEGIGFGLLPTPKKQNANSTGIHGQGGQDLQTVITMSLLPTPEANNYKTGHRSVTPRIHRKIEQGWTIGLNDLATLKLLPTPTSTSDVKGGCTRPDQKRQNDTLAHSIHGMIGVPGKTSQLNPRFVAEMMGFPPDWLELPFLNTETKVLKDMEMP